MFIAIKRFVLNVQFKYHDVLEDYYFEKAYERGFNDDDYYTIQNLKHLRKKFDLLKRKLALDGWGLA